MIYFLNDISQPKEITKDERKRLRATKEQKERYKFDSRKKN